MRVMIIGGTTDNCEEWEKIKNACVKIGKALRQMGHSLELCSPFEDSADFWTLMGFIEGESGEISVDFYYVKTDLTKERLTEIESDNKLKVIRIPTEICMAGSPLNCKCAQKGAAFSGWKSHLVRCQPHH